MNKLPHNVSQEPGPIRAALIAQENAASNLPHTSRRSRQRAPALTPGGAVTLTVSREFAHVLNRLQQMKNAGEKVVTVDLERVLVVETVAPSCAPAQMGVGH